MRTKPKTFDDYLKNLSEENRQALDKLRQAIKKSVPRAEECISYGLAAFRLEGRPFVALGATANHCAFYPMSGDIVSRHAPDLRGYDTSKGTIRFSPDQPLPATLLRKLLKSRLAELDESAKKTPRKKS
jgi:uncharacterized protein YdhG (YjbR/CyaY superfamily)